MKSIPYRYLVQIFSLGLFFLCFNPTVGQVLSLKTGSVVEKRILKGQTQEAQVNNFRGTLQWQQSADGLTWVDLPGETKKIVLITVTDNIFLRCAIREAECDPVHSDILKLTLFTEPKLRTESVVNITQSTAISGGLITDDGGNNIKVKGVCWNTTGAPTLADNKTADGSGTNSFTSALSGLVAVTTYFIKAYATNDIGTAYGNEIQFITKHESGTFTDSRDGHVYKWVKINNQTWMAENLAYLPAIGPFNTASDFVKLYSVIGYEGTNPVEAKATDNFTKYGVMYNWPAAMDEAAASDLIPSGVKGACPDGWHLPSDGEWTLLTDYLGPNSCKMMKSTSGWKNSGTGYNSSEFNAFPGGYREYTLGFAQVGESANFWTASRYDATNAMTIFLWLSFPDAKHYYWYPNLWFSVRCVKNNN